ncbi:MAG: RNA methyltransferase [Candidatus Eremiobacteraeota bacterium]|nr:RNA methyltransferase [Candidatus Eremiobacteraeota bacterium]
MALKEITSRQNHFIKYAASLKERKNRDIEHSCIVEGRNLLKDMAGSDISLRFLFVSRSFYGKEGAGTLLERLMQKAGRSFLIEDRLMEHLSTTESSPGILAVVETKAMGIEEAEVSKESFYLILDRLQDPGNLGTIFRTASAFGVTGVILFTPHVDPYNPKTVRASSGAIFTVPLYSAGNADIPCIKEMKSKGMALFSTSSKGGHLLPEWPCTTPMAVILGNESRGISPELRQLADKEIRVPMKPAVESLNVSITAALICYRSYELRFLAKR